MTHQTSVIALFCEDIREDKSGMLSLIGIFGDNANIPKPPPSAGENPRGLISKLHVYIRISFDVEAELGPISIKLILPTGETFAAGGVTNETVLEAKATREKGNPIASIISRLQIGGLIISKLGRLVAEVTIGTDVYTAGFLNFVQEDAVNPGPNVSLQLS